MAKEETYSAEYINDLIKRSGQSRATVFRKLKEGWTEDEIAARRRKVESVDDMFPAKEKPAEEPASVEPPAEGTSVALRWAESVMWAVDNLDTPKKAMTRAKAGSAMKYNLFLLGKENLEKLHGDLVPRALNILEKHKNPDGGDMAKVEEQNVEELKAILKQAIQESREQWIERN